MNGSVVLSPNEYERIKSVLKEFIEGEKTLSEIINELNSYLIIDFHSKPGERVILKNEIESEFNLPLNEDYLKNMLTRYLKGIISEQDLSDWSAFVYLTGFYIPEGATEDERWEAGELPLWDILQQLMSPSIFGGINSEKIRQYIQMLE